MADLLQGIAIFTDVAVDLEHAHRLTRLVPLQGPAAGDDENATVARHLSQLSFPFPGTEKRLVNRVDWGWILALQQL